MITVVGVTFRHQCKVYYFNPRELTLTRGQGVIVQTAQGIEYGTVVLGNHGVTDDKISGDLKAVVRVANEDDMDQLKLNQRNERDALRLCKERVAAYGLEMKLIRAEYAFDRTKLTFYFTADGRVDFRELVKDLAGLFRTRIELRQVGVRDETRLFGGIGACGRELCCATWLPDFVPVSIKMAKEQNLSLNSTKISGICGRLMCCLKHEEQTYEYLNARLPDINQPVRAQDGSEGIVKSVNVLLQKVTVSIDTGKDERELREYPVEELKFTPSKKKEKRLSAEEEKEAQELEG
ncbi:MAG: stage 0 sporulation family protein [Lachnospiraceae bacterium]|nr:stage 0 sporulation family protein [Lachnospiraceae bacterium]